MDSILIMKKLNNLNKNASNNKNILKIKKNTILIWIYYQMIKELKKLQIK